MKKNKNIKIIKENIKKNMTDEEKQKYREAKKHKYHNMTDEEKQKYKGYQKSIEKTWLMNKNKNIKIM